MGEDRGAVRLAAHFIDAVFAQRRDQSGLGQAHAHGGLDPEPVKGGAAGAGDLIQCSVPGVEGEGIHLPVDMGDEGFVAHHRSVEGRCPGQGPRRDEILNDGLGLAGLGNIAVADHDLALFASQLGAVEGRAHDLPARAQDRLAPIAAQGQIAVPIQMRPDHGIGLGRGVRRALVGCGLRNAGLFGQDGEARIGLPGLGKRQGGCRGQEKGEGGQGKVTQHGRDCAVPAGTMKGGKAGEAMLSGESGLSYI